MMRRCPAVVFLVWLVTGCSALAPRPDPPNVSLAGIKLVDMGLFEQRYQLSLRIQNPNRFSLPIGGMQYKLFLNDKEFATGVSDQHIRIPAFGEAVAEVDVISHFSTVLEQLGELGRVPSVSYRLTGKVMLTQPSMTVPFSYRGEVKLTSS